MTVWIIPEKCTGCQKCIKVCPYAGVEMDGKLAVLNDKCTHCGACVDSCKFDAIKTDMIKKEADLTAFKGVWAFAEQRDGVLSRVAKELLGSGRELADELGEPLGAVLVGYGVSDLATEIIAHGADIVYQLDDSRLEHYQTDSYSIVIARLIKDKKPNIVLYGATHIGRDLAPRIARKLTTGLTADCTELTIDPDSRNLMQTRPAFGGNVMATIETPGTRPQMATVRPGIMKALEPDEKREGEIKEVKVKLDDAEIILKVLERVKEARKTVNIQDADIIVSGGRGVGSKDGFKILAELAKVLGGEVGGSRVAVEKEWIPQDNQVGQTGKSVRPKLYIACGISGSIQHRAGMQNSDTIIAINKDINAPIFKVAHYGVVGNLHDVVPALTETLRRRSEGQTTV